MPDASTQTVHTDFPRMPANCKGGLHLELMGTYSEHGKAGPIAYAIDVSADGHLTGSATAEDGTVTLRGNLDWPEGASFGRIRWQEYEGSILLEAEGSISEVVCSEGPFYLIQAEYVSEYVGRNVQGHIQVQSAPGP